MQYQTIRQKGRKNITIQITSDARVLVKAPPYTAEQAIKNAVISKADWIAKNLSKVKNRVKLPSLEEGSSLYFAGVTYTVRYHDGKKAYAIGEVLYLPKNNLNKQLEKFVKQKFEEYVKPLTNQYASAYGFTYTAVKVGSARSRWACCTGDNQIIYSYSMAFIPHVLCVYVVCHELCHTVHKNHGKLYYGELCKIVPNYKTLRQELKKYSGFCSFLRQ